MTYSSRHCSSRLNSHTIPLKQQSSTKPSITYYYLHIITYITLYASCYSTNIIKLKGLLIPQEQTLEKLRIRIYGSIRISRSDGPNVQHHISHKNNVVYVRISHTCNHIKCRRTIIQYIGLS